MLLFYNSVIKPPCIPYHTAVSHLPADEPLTCRLLRKSGYSVSMELCDSSGKHRMKLPHATQAAEGVNNITSLVQVTKDFDSLPACRE